MKTIGARLRHIREIALGLSRKEFVEALGVSAKTLERYEADVRAPDAEFLNRLWHKYNKNLTLADFDWLLLGDMVAAEEEAGYKVTPLLMPEEQEYLDKLLEVLRNPATKKAIQENIDTFLKVPRPEPERKKKEE